jgi:hypothetical protein
MKKRGDFLITLAVRFVGGAVLGCIASVVLGYRTILQAFAEDEIGAVVLRFLIWGVIGGIVGMVTTPRWQTPWYKRDKLDHGA